MHAGQCASEQRNFSIFLIELLIITLITMTGQLITAVRFIYDS